MSYVNIHGKPLDISAKDAVCAVHTDARCRESGTDETPFFHVYAVVRVRDEDGWRNDFGRRPSYTRQDQILGSGATEDAAWRSAYTAVQEAPDAEQE